VRKFKN